MVYLAKKNDASAKRKPVRGFQLKVGASCNAPDSAYPASIEAELERTGDGQPRRGARFSPRGWSFADCDVLTAAVTGKGRHDLFKDIQLASRVIRGERSQVFHAGVVVAPRAIRAAAGVSEHHSTHSNAHVFFVPFLMTELQMALLSAARPASPPIPEEDRRASRGGGRAARGLVVVVFSLFALSVAGRLPLPASAPASAPGLGCVSFGWWGRPCAWGATRELGCMAVAVAVTAHGVAGGGSLSFSRLGLAAGAGFIWVWVLPRFFLRSVRTPGARGRSGWSSGRWVGALQRNRATKTGVGDYFCLPGGLL